MNNKWSKYNKVVRSYSSVFMSYDNEVKSNNVRGNYVSKTWIMKKVRENALEYSSGTHGNFQCGECGIRYGLSYGVYGKKVENTFGECEYFCKDCVKGMRKGSFVKM